MRFHLLNYEPYLTLLLDSSITFELGLKGCLESKELEIKLHENVKNRFKGENIDYINFVVEERINELFSSVGITGDTINYENYVQLFSQALQFLSQELISGLKIKRLEDFKFVTLYVEPNLILIKALKNEEMDFVIYQNNYNELIDLFLKRKYPYIDLHVHAESSYSFKLLLETIISYYNRVFNDLVKLDKRRTSSMENLRKINSIIEAFIGLAENRKGEDILRKVLLRAKVLRPKGSYNFYLLRRFSYDSFIFDLLRNIDIISDKNIALASVFVIQTINELNSSVVFTGEYKGLKQMLANFDHTFKRIYQKKRKKLFKKSDPIIEKTYRPYMAVKKDNNKYVEIRFSPEKDALTYWHEKTKLGKDNILFVLHYQKLGEAKDFIDYKKLTSFLMKQMRLTENLFYFLRRKSSEGIADRIVGFDAAAVEYWTPAWLYRVVFKFWDLVFKMFFNRNLIFTFHAGEDFIDLATGLRHVYEAVYFLKVHRLGHAMSLGVDIDRYLYRYQKVVMNPVFYFYHLLWLHHLTFKYKELFYYRLLILKEFNRFITKYGISNFLMEYSVKDYILKSHNSKRDSGEYPYEEEIYLGNQSLLFENLYENLGFFEFLFSMSLRRKHLYYIILNRIHYSLFNNLEASQYFGRIILNIHKQLSKEKRKFENIAPILSTESGLDRKEQLELLRLVQRVVQNFIKEKRIIIEVCPSSNVILYNIKSFSDHPLLEKNYDLTITINTDNPLLLNTNIQLEYAILADILKEDRKVEEFLENAIRSSGRNIAYNE